MASGNRYKNGDAGAMKLLLSLVDRYGDSQEGSIKLSDMLAEDREILAQYLLRPEGQDPAPFNPSSPPHPKLKPEPEGDDNDDAA